jgi:hypothetical protein
MYEKTALFKRFYTERHTSLRNHTQRSACLKRCASFKISDSKGESAIYYGAVYSNILFLEKKACADLHKTSNVAIGYLLVIDFVPF